MSEANALFYATGATVIPVLVVAYLIQANALADRWLEWALDLITFVRRLSFAFRPEGTVYKPSLLKGWVAGGLFLGLVALLLIVMAFVFVGFPVLGEYSAFHALTTDRTSPTATLLVDIGLITSGIAFLAPLIYTVAMRPLGIELYQQVKEVRKLRERSKEAASAHARDPDDEASEAGPGESPP